MSVNVFQTYLQSLHFDAEKLVCYLRDHGHSEGSYDQNMTVSAISLELLGLLQSDLVLWYFIIRQSVL